MNIPLFSIITVSFNSEKTIEKTIQSVLKQTFQNFEYIIVDGKSKDATIEIVKRYEPIFKEKLKWISEPDKGIYNAMNKGLMMAQGSMIGIVNSDDWLENDALETLVKNLKDNPDNMNKILTGEMLFHYSDGTTQRILTNFKRYEYYSKRYRMGVNHPATFVPRSIYDKIGLFDENFKLYADADFFIRCYEAGIGICFINKVLSNMCDGGASNRMSNKVLSDSLLKIRKHAKSPYELWYLTIKIFFLCCFRMVTPYSYVKRYRYFQNKE